MGAENRSKGCAVQARVLMKERIVAKTFEIAPGTPDFYRGSFGSCVFILKGGDAAFLLCDMDDCTFVPPYIGEDGQVSPEWADRTAGCYVTEPRSRTLLKPTAVAALAVPKIESRCRAHQEQPCYTPEKCVFDCRRKT